MPSMILLAPQLERRTVSFCRNKYSTTHEVKIQAPLRPPLLAEVTISCIVTLVSAGRVRLYFPLHGSVSGSVWWLLFIFLQHVQVYALFAWLIGHQPAVLFSQTKPATNNPTAVLFSQNKPAPAVSHQPNEQVVRFNLHNQTTSTGP
jgi:hypothetical protein